MLLFPLKIGNSLVKLQSIINKAYEINDYLSKFI